MAHFERQVRRVIFPAGFGRFTGDFSRFAGSYARVRVYARVKRVPVRRLYGDAEIVSGVYRTARPCVCISDGFPAVSRRLSASVSVAPGCRDNLPCMLTEKRDNFGFLFGIKSLFLWLCFWLQAGIFLEVAGACTSGRLPGAV